MKGKKDLLAGLMARSGMHHVCRKLVRWSGVLTLNYHRIGQGASSLFDRELWSADPEGFDAQVRCLKANYDVVSPDDLPELVHKGRGRAALITFDDGYADNYHAAFPILRRHGVKATFFVSTGFLDDPRVSWWDEIAWMIRTSDRAGIDVRPWIPEPVAFDGPDRAGAIRTLLRAYFRTPSKCSEGFLDVVGESTGTGRCPRSMASETWMTWDMVREMRSAGMTIGGHTVTHPVLARMPREGQWREISRCGERLAAELGQPMLDFSYPVGRDGAFNDETRQCLRLANVRHAFTFHGGFRQFEDWDDYDIPRVPVESNINLDRFRAMLSLPMVFSRSA
ncbi:MAG: polysaccharide deacetylase family protein [Isosphaeraceae bacterium]